MTKQQSTKTQLLEVALALFNDKGSAEVTTNQIAEAAGRSPGNLYYHFSAKEEMIRLLLQQLIERWSQIYVLPEDRKPGLQDLERMLAGNFDALWQYRFIYRDLPSLLHRDAKFRTLYIEARNNGLTNFRRLLDHFISAGVMLPIESANEVDELGELLWIVGDYWLPFIEAGGVAPDKRQIDRGISLFWRALRPYLRTQAK